MKKTKKLIQKKFRHPGGPQLCQQEVLHREQTSALAWVALAMLAWVLGIWRTGAPSYEEAPNSRGKATMG